MEPWHHARYWDFYIFNNSLTRNRSDLDIRFPLINLSSFVLNLSQLLPSPAVLLYHYFPHRIIQWAIISSSWTCEQQTKSARSYIMRYASSCVRIGMRRWKFGILSRRSMRQLSAMRWPATAATTGAHNRSRRVRKRLEIIFLRIQMGPSGPPSSISSLSPFPFCCQLEFDVRTCLAESRACENEHFRMNLTISLWSLTCSTAEVAKRLIAAT